MNGDTFTVRIQPRGHPKRTLVWGGVSKTTCDGTVMTFHARNGHIAMLLAEIAELQLDDDPGDFE